ncbi:MAG: DNA mismatch endonuclease Vsr [Erysipelotrichaceae bacterium]|nr:DNA mismatch endonuclease Vsr [Erysipelotrichaceae bacterium]
MNQLKEKNARMAAIKSKNTKPEVLIRKLLFANGFRYRINSKSLPGHPDIWLRKFNTVIFINGCFWHRHLNCKYAYNPKNHLDFWNTKFENNVQRDAKNREYFFQKGIKCLVVWECAINRAKTEDDKKQLFERIEEFLLSKELYLEI